MTNDDIIKIAIVYPGDAEARMRATAENNRFAAIFAEFAKDPNVRAEPAVYHPDLVDDVRRQLLGVDAALVWVNPIEDGQDRGVLNDMLRVVSDAGVYVSAHPDIISAMGTKEILVKTRHMAWGLEDTVAYDTLDGMRTELPPKLARGEVRVLKRNRGQSGSGVWLVRRATSTIPGYGSGGGGGGTDDHDDLDDDAASAAALLTMRVTVRHAERGSVERTMRLDEFFDSFDDIGFFVGDDDDGKVIDMAYQARLPEGTIRAYMVHDRIGGFGHQAINALHPTTEVPFGVHPRQYYPPGPEGVVPVDFQPLRKKMEGEWMPRFLDHMGMTSDMLPVLWDADFMFGPRDSDGSDSYVLCEINMSSVSPYPDYATPSIAKATIRMALIARSKRRA
jgi:hypothetical protein